MTRIFTNKFGKTTVILKMLLSLKPRPLTIAGPGDETPPGAPCGRHWDPHMLMRQLESNSRAGATAWAVTKAPQFLLRKNIPPNLKNITIPWKLQIRVWTYIIVWKVRDFSIKNNSVCWLTHQRLSPASQGTPAGSWAGRCWQSSHTGRQGV